MFFPFSLGYMEGATNKEIKKNGRMWIGIGLSKGWGHPVRFQGSPLGLGYKPLDAVAGTTEVKPFLANAVRATALPSRRS